jgi:hypothetical protein
MKKRIIFFVGFFAVLMSCNSNILDVESEKKIKQITGSTSVKIYEQGKDLEVDLFDSDISLQERKLFSSAIAKAAYEEANKTRRTLFRNGSTIVNYITNDKKDSYSVSNMHLFIAEEAFGNLGEICQLITELDKKGLMRFIDDGTLTSNQRDTLADKLCNEFKFPKVFTFNTYGFESSGNLFLIYMKLTIRNSVKRYRFDFNIASKKLYRLNMLK